MSNEENVGKHIAEVLSGKPITPWTHEEREEVERVTRLVDGVVSSYRSLSDRATDPDQKAKFEAEARHHYDDVRRRITGMTAEERQEVLRVYPDLRRRLWAELGW